MQKLFIGRYIVHASSECPSSTFSWLIAGKISFKFASINEHYVANGRIGLARVRVVGGGNDEELHLPVKLILFPVAQFVCVLCDGSVCSTCD